MNKSRLGLWVICGLFGVFIQIPLAGAVVFDAADMLNEGKFGIGLDTEILLSNPSSEGLEARVKYGLSPNFNTQGIIGIGSDYRGFRFGANNTLSIFPDIEGQIGVAMLLGGLYLRRPNKGVVIASAGPMIHKKFSDWTVPVNAFLAIPFAIELDSGRYYTGSQLTFGSILEFSRVNIPLELGIGMGSMETYVSAGAAIAL